MNQFGCFEKSSMANFLSRKFRASISIIEVIALFFFSRVRSGSVSCDLSLITDRVLTIASLCENIDATIKLNHHP